MKQNCWEFKKCGREIKGKNVDKLSECPAALEQKLNGVHNGVNAGRACWAVSGTLCENSLQGDFGAKFKKCLKSDFYAKVKEEGSSFLLSQNLLKKNKAKGVAVFNYRL